MDPNNLSRFDRMSIAMGIIENLKPEMLEFLQQFGKDFLDHVAVGYHNTQVQRLREHREDRKRRQHQSSVASLAITMRLTRTCLLAGHSLTFSSRSMRWWGVLMALLSSFVICVNSSKC